MIRTREYLPTDFAALVAMGRRFHQESTYSGHSYDIERLLELHDLILQREDLVGIVAEDGDTPVGMFIGGVAKFFFSNDSYGYDLCLFVDQNRRGSSAAIRLIRSATEWCKIMGAKELKFGASTGIDPPVTDRFYRGLGFEWGGVIYTRAL